MSKYSYPLTTKTNACKYRLTLPHYKQCILYAYKQKDKTFNKYKKKQNDSKTKET
jgi:hypothetical protein